MKNNNAILSDDFAALGEALMADSQLAKMPLDVSSADSAQFMKDYNYKVSPWPLIISDAFVTKLDKVLRDIPLVFHQVLKHFFTHEREWICDYLNIGQLQAQLYVDHRFDANDILTRVDAVVCDGDVRLIELNCGGSLGGWQLSWLQSLFTHALSKVPSLAAKSFKQIDVVEQLLRAYCQAALRLKGANAKGNMLFLMPETTFVGGAEAFEQQFSQLYKRVAPSQFAGGQLHFFTDISDVEVGADGVMQFKGIEMDAVILTTEKGDELPRSFYSLLESAANKGQFYYPDAICLTLAANKLLFALVHEPKVQAILTEQQRRLVNTHIPFSIRITESQVNWQGQSLTMDDFVSQHQHQLVIKKAHSMQGKDVMVGDGESAEDWSEYYQQHNNDPDWIVQHYQRPDELLCAEPELGTNLYQMVWGIFSLQGRYAGGFIRGSVCGNSAIINSARGAAEFALLQQQKVKQSLII